MAQVISRDWRARDVTVHHLLITCVAELNDDVPDNAGKTAVADQRAEEVAGLKLPVTGTLTEGNERVNLKRVQDQIDRRLLAQVSAWHSPRS